MSLIVKIEDFVGRRSIVKNSFTDSDYQYFLDYYEEIYLIELLGAELYDQFKADFMIDGTQPTDPIFKAIYEPFHIDNWRSIVISDGMKSMLLDFIYFEISRKSDALKNLSGNAMNISSNSSKPTQNAVGLYLSYNQGLKPYCAIQWYIRENKSDYPSYNGESKEVTTWL